MKTGEQYKENINKLKKEILYLSYDSKEGHIASSFSIMDILYILYNDIMKEKDTFILSKGHASLGYYSILKHFGKISQKDFASFGMAGGLCGHPHRSKSITATTGSLGHGLPMAVGIALSRKLSNEDGRVFVLLGDGECNEGTFWESMLVAERYKLNNLVVIVDNNYSDRAMNISNSLGKKCSAFECVVEEIDGHNHYDLRECLNKKPLNKPLVIICNTVKGCGCKEIEDNSFEWHHKFPKDEQELKKLCSMIEDNS